MVKTMPARFLAKNILYSLLLWCALALFASDARAQYRFDSWTTDNGLPQNSVRSILQTRDGYLWFTTLDGVVRYDGMRFRVFDKGNTKGIESNRFFLLVEDREGALWMATEDGGDGLRRSQHLGRESRQRQSHQAEGFGWIQSGYIQRGQRADSIGIRWDKHLVGELFRQHYHEALRVEGRRRSGSFEPGVGGGPSADIFSANLGSAGSQGFVLISY